MALRSHLPDALNLRLLGDNDGDDCSDCDDYDGYTDHIYAAQRMHRQINLLPPGECTVQPFFALAIRMNIHAIASS